MSFDRENPTFGVNADTLNAIVTAMGGFVFAVCRRLPPEQQQKMQDDFVRLAQARNAVGDTTAGTLLLDLAAAVESARKS